jgi:hypothetical protein
MSKWEILEETCANTDITTSSTKTAVLNNVNDVLQSLKQFSQVQIFIYSSTYTNTYIFIYIPWNHKLARYHKHER